ncbi:MAG TPA: DUF222 domain-containing protein [Solirubrobacteraceae bacterium]
MCSLAFSPSPSPSPDPSARSLEELEREICAAAADIAAATCRWLLLVAEFDERRGWAEWGVRSCAHWLSWRCSIGLVAGREHVRVARRLGELPLIREAFGAGELSYSKVRAVTRVAAAETEESLLELARHATGAQLDKLVRGYSTCLAATTAGAQVAYERRYLSLSWEEDGSLRIAGRLPAEEGALLQAALEAAQPAAVATQEPGLSASIGERRADAMATVARSALAGAQPRRGGDPCEIVVHVDADTLAGGDGAAHLDDGPAIAPETARRLGCDAALVRVIERDGQPLSVGRRTRTIPPALRRALRSRDGGCRFPGCTHRRFLHAHHIHHWARGGETRLDNLVQLCSHHHRLVHEGGFSVGRGPGGSLAFRRRDGVAIPMAGRCEARVRRGPVSDRRVDAETCRPWSAGDPLDYGMAVEWLLSRARAGPER